FRVGKIVVAGPNRAPVFASWSDQYVLEGDSLILTIRANDPNGDRLTLAATSKPTKATFVDNGDGTARFTWVPDYVGPQSADVSPVKVRFWASDGDLSSQMEIAVQVINRNRAPEITAPGTLAVEAGETLDFTLSAFDPDFENVSWSWSGLPQGTESFEYFWVSSNHSGIPGNVRIIGIANMGGGTPSLAPGDGAIARTRVHTSGNLDFAGMSIPLTFEFLDAPVNNDNTLTDAVGARINQGEIVYQTGSVLIHDIGQIRVGDINLNNVVAEIGDVIYFTNFFIHPSLYKFTALQYANSDINNDHIAASVSDLVALINWVVSGNRPFGKMAGDEGTLRATVTTEKREDRTVFAYDSPTEVGAVYLVFETSETVSPDMLAAPATGMTLDYRQDGREVKALLYSLEGVTLPAGADEILSVAGAGDVRIMRVELGSADGRMIQVELTAAGTELPTNYELMPNYPNPFNPETTIGFTLPASSQVELTIYNVIGQQVVTLINDEYPAGVHQVIWNGMDGEGRAVASGVYLYRLTAAGNVMTRKMMLLK
ncbi:MAG: T9SS type A sorting domain-containing protein, partial [candidate division Zixibacteria bacterium]|nr:T9SS type A sorting domain-containing protein [candidate division Zixibacteria bacterium]